MDPNPVPARSGLPGPVKIPDIATPARQLCLLILRDEQVGVGAGDERPGLTRRKKCFVGWMAFSKTVSKWRTLARHGLCV